MKQRQSEMGRKTKKNGREEADDGEAAEPAAEPESELETLRRELRP